MEEFYRLNPVISSSNTSARFHGSMDNMLQFEEAEPEVGGSEMMDLIKNQISNHPLYPNLVSAYIECQKVTILLLDNFDDSSELFILYIEYQGKNN